MNQSGNEEKIVGPEQSCQISVVAFAGVPPNQLKQSADTPESVLLSSSSPTTSRSDFHLSEGLSSNASGSESIVDDTEELTSSLSSSQCNISQSFASTDSPKIRDLSWKSLTSGSGSEELASDESKSDSVQSGSETEISFYQADSQRLSTSDCDLDLHSSDEFETDEDEEEAPPSKPYNNASRDKTQLPLSSTSSKIYSSKSSAGFQRNSTTVINQEFHREASVVGERSLRHSRNRSIGLLRRLDNYLHIMSVRVARYHKELCIVFLVFASGLASLRSPPPKIRVVSTPGPFFENKDAPYFLQDNYMGEYVDLANKQIPYHPSFLFYYAPWDSESVASKPVFLNVAKHFFFTHHGRVKFYAINCWWPGGQCRKNYKNLSHYPIFVAHIGKSAGIIYNGPIREEPIIKFINSLLKPVTRIDTEEELWRFRAQHDVIMLGYFNFTMADSNEAYETYLQMALRTFEADPLNQVGFGLFLRPELAEKFFLTSSNAISLVLFNEIHTAKWHGGYHTQGLKGPVSQVAEWIVERTKSVPLTWVYALRNGFANRPAALGPYDFAQQLSKGPVFLLVSRRYFPSGHSPFYTQVKEVALDYYNCNKSGNVTKLRRTSHKVNSEWASLWSSVVQICQRKVSFQCQQLMPNINHWIKKQIQFKREPLSRYENFSSERNFTGLSCVSERQFKFLAVDPVDVPYFIELGLSGLKPPNVHGNNDELDPMAFIIDSENDVILPLSSLNITEMAYAIYNYTVAVENDEHIDDRMQWSRIQNLRTDSTHLIVKPKSAKKQNSILNWSSAELLAYIDDKDRTQSVLLMYTASFCGFCAIALTHLVSLSRFLEENYGGGNFKVNLVKIDMFKNSLPPSLSPEKLPSIVFIPSWNSSDVRMYPENQEITSLGLLRFILGELDPQTRVRASLMVPSCSNSLTNGACNMTPSDSDPDCHSSSTSAGVWSPDSTNSTQERTSCLRSSRTSVSGQIELLLQKLQNGEEAMFSRTEGPLNPMTPQQWNGEVLDRLRTMAVTLDVS